MTMVLRELLEATQIWSRSGGKQVRKYRCTSGMRKGRVMASPASCSKPLNIQKSASMKNTKHRKGQQISMTGARTRKSNPSSIRLQTLNKPKGSRRIR